jgi:hypothetical protein
MAADDAAVVVTLRANLKDYEAALKTAVRQTERAAQAAEKAVSNIGKTSGGRGLTAINDNFSKSAQQIQNDARILQFQLNDIFSGLASGQGIRALQMQLGQIAQQLGGGGLAQGARTLGAAMAGMVNPINLAVVGFGLLASVAASYFSDSEDGADKTSKAIKEQAAMLRRVADAYGEQLPAVKALADELERIAKLNDAAAGTAVAVAKAYEPVVKQVEDLAGEAADLALKITLALPQEKVSEFANKWDELNTKLKENKATAEDIKPVVDALMASGVAGADELVKKLQAMTTQLDAVSQKARQAETDLKNMTLGFQFPGAGGPLDLGPITGQNRVDLLNKSLEGAADAIDGFVERVIQAESGGRSAAANPRSTAVGAGQFLESTWLEVFKRNFAAEAAGMSDAAILAMRTDVETNRRMIRAYATENARDLKNAGQEVTEATLQLAHFLGSGGAVKVLQAAPGTRIRDIPGMGRAVAANPEVLGGGATREDVLAYANRRAGANREQKQTYDELVASINTKIAAQERENAISGDSTRSTDDKTAALAREKAAQEAATVAKQLDAATVAQYGSITDAQKEKNRQLAEQYAATGLKAEELALRTTRLAEEQRKATQEAETHKRAQEQLRVQMAGMLASMATQAITGIVQDLRNGTDAATAFYNAISRIADQLLSFALNMAFRNLFGSLFGAPMGGMPMFGFASGGYTGDQPVGRAAGIVHGQEFVVNAKATRQHRDLLEAINRGAPGYASGGFVLPNLSQMLHSAQAARQQSAAPSVNTRTTVVNTFDSGSFLSEALSRPDGVNVILNAVRAQPGAFRQAMQG